MEDTVLDSKDKTEENKHGSCTCGANLVVINQATEVKYASLINAY